MKRSLLTATLLATFSMAALAQVPAGNFPRDSSTIRDDNHELRPDRVDQRSPDVGLNANDARDARHKRIKEYREQQKAQPQLPDDSNAVNRDVPPPKPKPTTPGY